MWIAQKVRRYTHDELVFFHLMGSVGPECVLSIHITLTHYFSYSCMPGVDATTSTPGHIMPKLCFCIR
jgi:hypothetical protein